MDLSATTAAAPGAAAAAGNGGGSTASAPAPTAGGAGFAPLLQLLALGLAGPATGEALAGPGGSAPGSGGSATEGETVANAAGTDGDATLAASIAGVVGAPIPKLPQVPVGAPTTASVAASPAASDAVCSDTPGSGAAIAAAKLPTAAGPGAQTTVTTDAEGRALGAGGTTVEVAVDPGAAGHGETPVTGAGRGRKGSSAPSGRPPSQSHAGQTRTPDATAQQQHATHGAERTLASVRDQAEGRGAAEHAAPLHSGPARRAVDAPEPVASSPASVSTAQPADGTSDPRAGTQDGADRSAGEQTLPGPSTASSAGGQTVRPIEPGIEPSPSAPRATVVPVERPLDPPALRDVERLVQLDAQRPVVVRDGGEMRVTIEPQGLGHVELRIAVDANAVHATLTASHEHARDMLSQHRPQLEAALERSQLRLEGFNVNLGQHHQPRDPGEMGGRPWPLPTPGSVPSVAAAVPGGADPVRARRGNGALSLLA